MIGGTSLRYGGIALWCLIAAGCADLPNDPTEPAISVAVPASPDPANEAAAPEPAPYAAVAALPGNLESPANEQMASLEREPTLPPTPTADGRTEATKLADAAPAARATAEVESPPALVPSSTTPATVTEALDFTSLLTRLRKTKAIGLLTKVAFKSESDSLLERFRAYHTQQGAATLTELRHSYDSLFHKLYSLLQDADPPLARDIDRSQAAIWDFLSDPRKFSASPLLAGA